MAQERRHKKRRRRRGRFPGLYRLVSVVLILAAVAAALIIFFRVDKVTVQGNSRYTDREIIDVTGIKEGDNLFTINRGRVARALLSRLPYIQSASVRLTLPDTISVTVTEGDAAAAVSDGGHWWLVGSDGKLLEESRSAGGYPTVTGLVPLAPAVGTYLAAEEERQGKVEDLRELLSAMEANDLLTGVTAIDMSGEYEVVFECEGRFTVYLSTTLERGMSYWLYRFAVCRNDPSVDENQAYNVYIRDGEKIRFTLR